MLVATLILIAASPAPADPYVPWIQALPLDQLRWPFETGDPGVTPTSANDGLSALKLDGATVAGAAPQRYYIKYDTATRWVAFQRGCCSWGEQVLEQATTAPPDGLAPADYISVKTDLGIRIGSTLEEVKKIFGPVKTWITNKSSSLRGVEYRHRIGPTHPTCVKDYRFVFGGGNVVAISFVTSC